MGSKITRNEICVILCNITLPDNSDKYFVVHYAMGTKNLFPEMTVQGRKVFVFLRA